MATTTARISWQAFEELPDGDGFHREVVEGELVILPPAKSGHTKIARLIERARIPLEGPGIAEVYTEAGYKLSSDPPTWIQPDVSVLRIERVRAIHRGDHFLGAPEFAIEIVSHSETARDLNRKIDALLAGGSIAIWVIYPEEREVRAFVEGGASFVRREGDMLTLPELLADWELPVAKLFED
jgi:Uma2 family endonuclease